MFGVFFRNFFWFESGLTAQHEFVLMEPSVFPAVYCKGFYPIVTHCLDTIYSIKEVPLFKLRLLTSVLILLCALVIVNASTGIHMQTCTTGATAGTWSHTVYILYRARSLKFHCMKVKWCWNTEPATLFSARSRIQTPESVMEPRSLVNF